MKGAAFKSLCSLSSEGSFKAMQQHMSGARQVEIAVQIVLHEKLDQNFYVTANIVKNLATRARKIFESSEVDEKCQHLNLGLQNLQIERRKFLVLIERTVLNDVRFQESSKRIAAVGLRAFPPVRALHGAHFEFKTKPKLSALSAQKKKTSLRRGLFWERLDDFRTFDWTNLLIPIKFKLTHSD